MELESYSGKFFHGDPPKTAAPFSEYGLSLFWSDDSGVGLTGLTELVQQERCEDPWYSIMLDECRAGQLSEDNCNFLHGKPTLVPGSWMADTCGAYTMCGLPQCMELAHNKTSPDVILQNECSVCRAERTRRTRVAAGEDDPRFQEKMSSAVLIVPNNDIKSHANKKKSSSLRVEDQGTSHMGAS